MFVILKCVTSVPSDGVAGDHQPGRGLRIFVGRRVGDAGVSATGLTVMVAVGGAAAEAARRFAAASAWTEGCRAEEVRRGVNFSPRWPARR